MRALERLSHAVLQSPRGLYLAVLAGVALTLPSLGMGFVLDDYAHIAMIEGWYTFKADFFNLFAFLGDILPSAWWKHPNFQIAMWRPLTSALLQLDHELFGRNAVAYHLHSLLWLAGLLAAAGLLYSRILPRKLAVLALFVFALDECHTQTASWIANRHAMVAMLPALLGLYAHLRWRCDGWRPGLPLSMLGYTVGLLGGEVTLCILAYVVSFELFAPPPGGRRLAGLVPAVTIGGAYAVWYVVGGFGAAKSGFYLDPMGEPLAFLAGVAGHLPALLTGAFLGLPSDLWFFSPEIRPVQVILGWAALLGVAAFLHRVWPTLAPEVRRALSWLLPGAFLALLPVTIAQPSDRLLIGFMLGGAVLIAVLLDTSWRLWHELSRRIRMAQAADAALTLFLIAVHFGMAPFGRVALQQFLGKQWDHLAEVAADIPVETSRAAKLEVVVLTAPDPVIGGFLPLIYGFQGHPRFKSWDVLSLAPYDHRLTRTGSATLELEVIEGELLTSLNEQFFRSASEPLGRGDVIATRLFDVEILADNGRGPTRVAFHFRRNLEDASLAFLSWGPDGLQPAQLPAIGGSLILPQAPGPLAAAGDDLSAI